MEPEWMTHHIAVGLGFCNQTPQSPTFPNPVWVEQISIKCQRKEKRTARSHPRKLCKCLGDGYGRCPPHASVCVLCLGMVMVALSSSLCLWAVIGFFFLTQGFRVSFLSPCLIPSVTTIQNAKFSKSTTIKSVFPSTLASVQRGPVLTSIPTQLGHLLKETYIQDMFKRLCILTSCCVHVLSTF